MVRFGFDEPLDEEPANVETSREPGDSKRASWMKMPGSFVFDSPYLHRQADAAKMSSISSPANASEEPLPDKIVDHTMADFSEDIDDGPSQATAKPQSETISDSILESTYSDHSDALVVDQETLDWPTQLHAQRRRFKLLQTSAQQHVNNRREARSAHLTSSRTRYTAHELDHDLFHAGDYKIRPITMKTQLEQSDPGFAKVCPRPRPFIFNWSSHGMLFHKANSLAFKADLQLDHEKSLDDSFARSISRLTDKSDVHQDADSVPWAIVRTDLQARQLFDPHMSQSERSVWHLASALFDPIHDDKNVSLSSEDVFASRLRTELVSKWLETAILATIRLDERSAKSQSELMYIKLTGHLIAEACSVALSSREFHLATILPLIGGDIGTRADLEQQLAYWRQKHDDELIEDFQLRIYNLLVGNVDVASNSRDPSSQPYFRDWKRLFGIHLWYKNSTESTVKDIVRQYLNSQEHSALKQNLQPDEDLIHGDLHLYLLHFYATSEQNRMSLITPRVAEGGMNCAISWCIQVFLSGKTRNSVVLGGLPQDSMEVLLEFDQFTISLSSILECKGNWNSALFVLLFISNKTAREAMIKRLLARLRFPISSSQEHFILQTLEIPKTWLLEATALSLRTQESYEIETQCLLEAGLWTEAHSTVLKHIAPQSIISGRLDRAHALLSRLSEIRGLEDWERGGQPYKDAMDLMIRTRGSDVVKTVDSVSKDIWPQFERLRNGLTFMRQETFEQRVAKHEIARILLAMSPASGRGRLLENRQISDLSSTRMTASSHFESCLAAA